MVAARPGIGDDKGVATIGRLGNTSSASIPEVLAEAASAGPIDDRDLALLSGFGTGMTWTPAVLR